MKRPRLSPLLGVFLTSLSIVPLSGCASCGRTTSGDLDINSGDYRYQEYRGKRLTKEIISESSLSREARRLGIVLPAEPKWVPAARSRPGGFFSDYGRKYEDYAHGFLMGACGQLVMILARTNTPDDERRVVLEQFLTSLRTGDARCAEAQAYLLIEEVANKRGLRVSTPELEAPVKQESNRGEYDKPGSKP